VRLKAIRLMKPLLTASLPDETAKPAIDTLGEILNRATEPDELRRGAAALLAECGKAALAFPHIELCLASNGISADLRLELVKGLNTPLAANRLRELLKAEMAAVETRSGPVLDRLIFQVRWVLETEDRTPTGADIVAELDRLLQLVVRKVSGQLDAPARKRFVDLAVRACDTLVHAARLSGVDISVCLPALARLACTDTAAAPPSLTVIREALNVKRGRDAAIQVLTTPPSSEKLAALYQRLIAGSDEVMAANLLVIYEDMAVAPEPIDKLQQRLLERARNIEAVLPDRPNSRRSVRDGLRALLAKLNTESAQHVALINELMLCKHGAPDVVGYIQALKPPRGQTVEAALQPHVKERLIKVALVIAGLESSLTDDEKNGLEYVSFRTQVQTLFRAHAGSDLERALKDGIDDDGKASMAAIARGPLRETWVPVAIEKLREAAAPSPARDTISEVLLSTLKKAHPARYDNVALAGLSKEDFIKALDDLGAQLKQDRYTMP
jgi:hypothetical protein